MFNFINNKDKKVYSSTELLDKHNIGEITDSEFFKHFGNTNVFYSTPFGDHKDGGQRVFLLAGPDNSGYHPVFCSQEHLVQFYEKAGRIGYMIMQGPFSSVLETTKNINASAPIKMGIIIEPGYYNITVDARALDEVINIKI